MELHQLRYFAAAAEAGSLTRAARRVHVSQPTLSQQIAKLEEELDTPLFDRLGRGVSLTAAGRALLPRARRILAEVQGVEAELSRDVEEGAGAFSVGAIPTMAPYVLPSALRGLSERFPRCEVTVREDFTERLVEALVDNELDCAVMSTPVDHPLIELEVVGSEQLLVATPATLPLCDGATCTIAMLRDQPTVVLRDVHCLGRQIQGFCGAHELARRIVCRTAQLSTVQSLVGLGFGVSLVPEMAAACDAATDRRYYRLDEDAPEREIAVAWRASRSRTLAARTFVELLREDLATGGHRYEARACGNAGAS